MRKLSSFLAEWWPIALCGVLLVIQIAVWIWVPWNARFTIRIPDELFVAVPCALIGLAFGRYARAMHKITGKNEDAWWGLVMCGASLGISLASTYLIFWPHADFNNVFFACIAIGLTATWLARPLLFYQRRQVEA